MRHLPDAALASMNYALHELHNAHPFIFVQMLTATLPVFSTSRLCDQKGLDVYDSVLSWARGRFRTAQTALGRCSFRGMVVYIRMTCMSAAVSLPYCVGPFPPNTIVLCFVCVCVCVFVTS